MIRFFLIFFSFSLYSIQPASLLHKSWSHYSQSGEEGILEEILHRLGVNRGFFVEFGAKDGTFYSNTRFLAEKGWEGAWIECDPIDYQKLRKSAHCFSNVQAIHEFVTFSKSDQRGLTFDDIAQRSFPEKEIDVLSIDIDGLDYLIFESLQCRPKIICIESSGYWHPELTTRISDEIAKGNLGQPISVMVDIARQKGYEPICFLTVNLFLIRKDLYPLFAEINNDPITLWLESWEYMKTNRPRDQIFIKDRRTLPEIHNYDALPTPS